MAKHASLDQLSALKPRAPETPKYVRSSTSRPCYATGKRKNAVARVWSSGAARSCQTRARSSLFRAPVLRMLIQQPWWLPTAMASTTSTARSGGGLSDSGAVRHGISKALMAYEPDLRGALKKGGPHPRPACGRAQEVRKARPPQLPFSKR